MLMPLEGKGNLFLPQIIFLPQNKGIILPLEGILFPLQGIMFPQKGIMGNLSHKGNMFPQKGKQLRRISNVKFVEKVFEITGN